ncbi:MAG: hypothetical protein ABII01_01515 [Candidatus Woesearchaeota archaeon]
MNQIKRILITKEGRTFYVKDLSNDYHCEYGLVLTKDLKKKDGAIVKTNKGIEMTLLMPKFFDVVKKIKRGAQIITRKDIGEIIVETGLNKDSIVVDCGAGSGGLACYLAFLCKKVTSYDIRQDHLELVKKNMEFLGLKNLVLKLGMSMRK